MSDMRKQAMLKSKTMFQADKVVLDQEKDSEQLATWEDAVKYRNKFSVMKTVGESSEQYGMNCDLSELAQYGPGLRLFFEFIKYSAMIFLLMSLISIPALYSNGNGQSLDSIQLSTNSLSKISLSNQPKVTLVTPPANSSNSVFQADYNENIARIQAFADDAGDRLLMVAIPDLTYSIVFFLFIVWFHYHSTKVSKDTELKNSLPSHYAIEISGFPSTVIDGKDISSHFRNHFGVDVFECHLVRNYYNTLFLHKEEAKLIDQMKSEKSRQIALGNQNEKNKKLEKLALKLAVVQEKIHKQVQDKMHGKSLSHNEYPSIKAFLVLNNIDDKLKIEKEYHNISSFLCFSSYPKSFLLDGKHELKINFKPDEPSNLLWENLEVTKLNRFGRTLVVLICVIIVMLITFGIIIVANIVKPSDTESCPSNTITQAEASQSSLYTNCYCMSVSFSQMTSDSSLQNLCWDVWVKYATTYALTIVTGLVILIVNTILRLLIDSLGKFNRYNTISKFSTSMFTKLFLAIFVNTALITLFLQADIYGFVPAITFSKPIPPLSNLQDDKKQEFSADFDRSWYLSIGSKITVTVFFFIITHLISEFLMAPLSRYFREKKVKKLVGNDVQRVANKSILGPEFSITFYYASTFNIIFTTLFYSSGIPIMLFAGFFILTIQYWVYKYRLLRICRRPPTYDTGLNSRLLQILPWSLLLHLCIGLYMYGQPLIFPRSASQIQLNMVQSTGSVSVSVVESDPVQNRAFHVLYIFILLLVVVGLYVLTITYQSFSAFFSCLCSRKRTVAPISQRIPYNEEYGNIEQRMLPSYSIKVNEQYRYIIQAIDLEKKIDSENSPRHGTASNGNNYQLKDGDSVQKNANQLLEDI